MPYRPKASRYWHYDFQLRGRRFCGSTGTQDHATAKGIEAQARVAAAADPQVTGRYTLSQALGTYWTDICAHQPSARTARAQAAMILTVLDGATAIDMLTNADLQRFVARRRATVSNATVNRQLALLSRALRHMARVHGAALRPLDFAGFRTAEPQERVRELSWAEQARLFRHLRPDLHPMVQFALATGARISTIAGLRWTDIDADGGRMRFRVKGGKTMQFPLNREIRALLSALPRSDLPAERGFVFTYQDRSAKTHPRRRIVAGGGGLMADFRAALAAAGIDDFRFHDLRHSFATRLLRATGNLKLVSRLLGHAGIETTMRYAHVMDDDLADAMATFSALTAPGSRSTSRSPVKKNA